MFHNFKLITFCCCTAWFVSNLVRNFKDTFSRDMVHLKGFTTISISLKIIVYFRFSQMTKTEHNEMDQTVIVMKKPAYMSHLRRTKLTISSANHVVSGYIHLFLSRHLLKYDTPSPHM